MPTVLVIDDEAGVRSSMELVLTRGGFRVVTADNGRTGVEAFGKDPADVVIVDVIMPRWNGIDVIKAIRESHPGARIIAISGGGNFGPLGYKPDTLVTESYLATAAKYGADAVMQKPFHRSELLALVRSLLKN